MDANTLLVRADKHIAFKAVDEEAVLFLQKGGESNARLLCVTVVVAMLDNLHWMPRLVASFLVGLPSSPVQFLLSNPVNQASRVRLSTKLCS